MLRAPSRLSPRQAADHDVPGELRIIPGAARYVAAVDAIQDKGSTGEVAEVGNIAVHQRSLLAISPVPWALGEGAGGGAEAMKDCCGPLLHVSCALPLEGCAPAGCSSRSP